jgi:hypothetical protein
MKAKPQKTNQKSPAKASVNVKDLVPRKNVKGGIGNAVKSVTGMDDWEKHNV